MDVRWIALSKEQLAKKLWFPFFRFTATGVKSEGFDDHQSQSYIHFPALKRLLNLCFFKF